MEKGGEKVKKRVVSVTGRGLFVECLRAGHETSRPTQPSGKALLLFCMSVGSRRPPDVSSGSASATGAASPRVGPS